MKKINIISIAALMAFSLTGCSDYLDVDQTSILSGDYMFKDEKTAEAGLVGCYDTFYPTWGRYNGDLYMWTFKPEYQLAGHRTLDTQEGTENNVWDAYDSSNGDVRAIWTGNYDRINRCNEFLAGLTGMDASMFSAGQTGKDLKEAQARLIRVTGYYELVKNFGRVPLLKTGDDYSNTPNIARCDKAEDVWNFIIEDCEFAASKLDWQPLKNSAGKYEYGRMTKGMALAYEAKAYLYLKNYDKAKAIYKQIIDSGTYSLEPCYSYLFDSDKSWSPEDIWAVVMWNDDGADKWSWGPSEDHYIYAIFSTGATEFGGWGSLAISWEYYYSFENGDRRLHQSVVGTGDTNVFTKQTLSCKGTGHKMQTNHMPNVFSTKYWRKRTDWAYGVSAPFTLHYFRYAEVLLDYAECCFKTNDENEAWKYIGIIRNRAWGNLETTVSDDTYPIELQKQKVDVPDAKTYYTKYKAEKGYTCDLGILAVNMERRHEFNAEFSLYYDFIRTGFNEEFVNKEYPKGLGNQDDANDWHTHRTFDYLKKSELLPIPQNEIDRNTEISDADQNPGY